MLNNLFFTFVKRPSFFCVFLISYDCYKCEILFVNECVCLSLFHRKTIEPFPLQLVA